VSTRVRTLSHIGIGATFSCLVLALVLIGDQPKATESKSLAPDQSRSIESQISTERPLPGPANTVEDLVLLERNSRNLPPIQITPDEPTIASLTARRLELTHYRKQTFDDTVSAQFLDRYINSLDHLRLHFLQSDLDEFERYRTRLDELTLRGNTDPAREIFARFIERLSQRVLYVAHLLDTEKFDFTGDDRYRLDRRQAPFPGDINEARKLWRQHLRHEVLQEILSLKTPASDDSPDSDGAATLDQPPRQDGLTDEIIATITRRYSRLLRTFAGFDGSDVFQIYLTALAHVYDPHSDYMGKSTLENFAINMNLSLFGIGAVLQSEDGFCKVRELKPGPAMRSKQIKPGDRIVAVAQADDEPVDVVDMKLSKVVDLIRGPKGTQVRLSIIPVDATDPSERNEVTLTRDEIRLEDEEAKAMLIETRNANGDKVRVGIIDLPSFYAPFDVGQRPGGRSRSTTVDVANLIEKLKQENVSGILLDLRGNGGGSLEEAIQLTGLFIGQGPIVQIRDFQGNVIVEENDHTGVLYDGPLVVLTSRYSASASEILAGALQDYGRALVVGDSSTHGKGTVQSLIQLQPMLNFIAPKSTNNPGALKITVRKFYRASGASTQLEGVVPDIILPSLNNYAEVGEASLDNPLPWDTIPSARFRPENRIAPILPELRHRSEQRIATDQDFLYILEDVEIYRKFLADKSVVLNEAERRREKQENEQRLEARANERAARPAPEETAYEITLKHLSLPGLPPPIVPSPHAAIASPETVLAGDDDESSEDNQSPAIDATLKEAKRILLDLVDLSAQKPALATSRQRTDPSRN
jgi:carboxyl-terminal processing protease